MIPVVIFVIGICKMSDKKSKRPPDDSPEIVDWLAQECEQDFKDVWDNHQPAEFEEEEGGAIFGDINDLGKSDAELFPDELEEYTREERKKAFKVHKGSKNNNKNS